jgi:tRNA-dihydrouridine synthase
MISPKPTPLVLLAPMEGLLDFVLRDILTRVGGIDRCVSEFIRITDQLLALSAARGRPTPKLCVAPVGS